MAASASLQAHIDWRKSITCRYFIHGLCREGDRCSYAHTRPDSKNNVCWYYLQGKCLYGDSCKFQHVIHTTQKTAMSRSPVHVSSKDINVESHLTNLSRSDKTAGRNEEKGTTSKYRMADLINAKEFIPGQPFQGSLPPTYSAAAKKTGQSEGLVITTDPVTPLHQGDVLCPYAIKGICRYGAKCLYMHGAVCDLCGEACLLPFDEEQKHEHREACLKKYEKEMQEAFLYQQSKDIVCGICMEVIMDKSPRERKFGILSDCTHPYCLDCIRKWRSGKQFEKTIIRGCPTCRKMSNFVTPSDYWVEDPDEKKKLIEKYKSALSAKPCKYFDQGRGKCPFGADCFYLHAYPDGSKEDRSKVRHCRSSSNKIKMLRPALLWEFFEQRNSLLDFGSDEDDFFLFGSSLWHDELDYFSELSEADDLLEYLQYIGSDYNSENDLDSDWSRGSQTSDEGEDTLEPLPVNDQEDREVDADDEWEEGIDDGQGDEEEQEEQVEQVEVSGNGSESNEVAIGVECMQSGYVVDTKLVNECGYSEDESPYSDCGDW